MWGTLLAVSTAFTVAGNLPPELAHFAYLSASAAGLTAAGPGRHCHTTSGILLELLHPLDVC
jgi:hypothetical protein